METLALAFILALNGTGTADGRAKAKLAAIALIFALIDAGKGPEAIAFWTWAKPACAA